VGKVMGCVDKVVKYKYKGQSVASYCRENKLSYSFIYSKIRKGMPIEDVIELAHKKYQQYDETTDLSVIAENFRIKYQRSTSEERRILKKEFFKVNASEHTLEKYWEDIVFNRPQKEIKEIEIWKTTKENPNYEVSNFGRFRRVHKQSEAKYTAVRPYKSSHQNRKGGKVKTKLKIKLGSKEYLAKKIVANAFVENPNNYTCVIEDDGNITNIKASNLKWLSKREVGKMTGHLSKSRKIKLIDPITKEVKIYRSMRECARQNHVSHETIRDYLKGKVKKPMFEVAWV
jgi:lambda repressor-like predicted transcriptional regulator